MPIFTITFWILVSREFFYIFYLETLATSSQSTSRVFEMSEEELVRPIVNTFF